MTYNLPTHPQWIEIIKRAVMHCPQEFKGGIELKSKRAQSFTYVEHITSLASVNNETSSKDSPYYFDRQKAISGRKTGDNEVSLPNVSLYERTEQFDYVFQPGSSIMVSNARIIVVDNIQVSATGTEGYRHYSEVIEDSILISTKILAYLNGVKRYRYDIVSGVVDQESWFNKDYCDYLVNSNKIQNAVELDSREFELRFRAKNKDILFRNIRMEGVGKYYGVVFDIDLPCWVCLGGVNFDTFSDYEVDIVRGG